MIGEGTNPNSGSFRSSQPSKANNNLLVDVFEDPFFVSGASKLDNVERISKNLKKRRWMRRRWSVLLSRVWITAALAKRYQMWFSQYEHTRTQNGLKTSYITVSKPFPRITKHPPPNKATQRSNTYRRFNKTVAPHPSSPRNKLHHRIIYNACFVSELRG